MVVATCEPTVQASGCLVQKPRMSPTVADAAEMASEALTSLADGLRGAAPVGNSTRTTPSQNAIRNKKNMTPTSPAGSIAAPERNLAGSLEGHVGGVTTFLSIIEQNTLQIFGQIEIILFT
jgi:hypothetical protein